MSSSEQRLPEEHLQEEIEELRAELGETVEALAHKADVRAQVTEHGKAMKEQALDRGVELHQQAVQRGSELSGRVIAWCNEAKVQALGRARESVNQTPMGLWATLGGAAVTLLAMAALVRRRRTC